MKETLKKIIIIGLYISWLPRFRMARINAKRPVVRVIAFHDIPEEDKENFRELIEYLDKKYNIISPDDFANNSFSRNMLNLLITFDDGYYSWYVNVMPVLKEFDVRPILFVTSGFINTCNSDDEEKYFCKEHLKISHKKPMSWGQVRDFTSVSEIGGHTLNHINMFDTPAVDIEKDLAEDKETIENRTGTSLRFFAYPYGTKNVLAPDSGAYVKDAGYQYAFTTKQGFVVNEDPFLIPRTMIDGHYSKLYSSALIEGSYDRIKNLF